MLAKRNRISNRRLIAKLASQGDAYRTRSFVFKFLPSLSSEACFSISISKKIAPKATQRNRLKRQISHALRAELNQLQRPIVCLVIQKKGSPEKMAYQAIEAEVQQFTNSLKKND